MGKKQMMFFCSLCQALLLVFLLTGHALADEVILRNGGRLTGKIVAINDGVLTLETGYSEPVKLQFEAVQQMSSSEPVELHLTGGEILKGKIISKAARQVEMEAGPDREAVTIGFDTITALNPPPKKLATWKGNVTLGGNWQDGNTDAMNISAAAQAVRRSENDRFQINVLYNMAKDSGKRTAENTYGQLKYDYFLSPKWYLYMNIDMLSDDFKDINLRTSVGPGAGYQIWDEEDKALNLEAGLSYTNVDRDEGEDTDWVSARLGFNFLDKLFDGVVFTDQFVIYPKLDDMGEYTLRNEAALATEIVTDVAMKFSNIWERDSDPGEGVKEDDFTWILGVQYTF